MFCLVNSFTLFVIPVLKSTRLERLLLVLKAPNDSLKSVKNC